MASLLGGLLQVALVQWTESVGLTLVNRDLTSMQLRTPGGQILTYRVLQMFPFTSEGKRMGIIVRVGATRPHAGLYISDGRCGVGPSRGDVRRLSCDGSGSTPPSRHFFNWVCFQQWAHASSFNIGII